MTKLKSFGPISLCVLLIVAALASADVKLPAVIGDNMVLQQNTSASLWGWAGAGEQITVKASWHGGAVKTSAAQDGKWLVRVPTPKASGPHTITIKGNNTIELKNVMSGEVWVCSGQSNMQWTVSNSNGAKEEIAAALCAADRISKQRTEEIALEATRLVDYFLVRAIQISIVAVLIALALPLCWYLYRTRLLRSKADVDCSTVLFRNNPTETATQPSTSKSEDSTAAVA